MIAKFEKSGLSIRLADKMDNMDRTWRWFINPFFRMCNRKVIDLFGVWNDVNETYPDDKVRIVVRISCKVVYYLVIAMVAYITTRDQGDYFAESDLSNMETHYEPSFHYKLIWALVVFLVLSM